MNVPCPLTGMCILLLLCRMFYKCYLGPVDGVVLFRSSISTLIFCLIVQSVAEKGGLNCPTTFVDLSISPFSYIIFCLIYVDALLLGMSIDIFRTVMSSWRMGTFIIMQCPS